MKPDASPIAEPAFYVGAIIGMLETYLLIIIGAVPDNAMRCYEGRHEKESINTNEH